MAQYTVQAPDGKTITMEGPEGASPEDVIAQARKLYKPSAQPENHGFLQPAVDLAKGVVKGAGTTLTNAAKGLAWLAPSGEIGDVVKPLAAKIEPHLEPHGFMQGAGKFAEQTAEFALPTGAMSAELKGAGLLARAGGQAAVGAGVSALQSGGDPTSTAVGGAIGGASEVIPAMVAGTKNLLANKAPTLANWSESFGNATPTQKARISKALDVLGNEVPPETVHETQDLIKGKLSELGQAYDALDPAIKARTQPVQDVVKQLQSAQSQFMRRGVITDKAGYDAVQGQIDTLNKIAANNGGNIQLDDLIHMKQLANGKTNFQSPDADKSLWRGIGNAYRSAADALAPETTPLNRAYQKFSDLEQIIDQNIERGKGTTKSGLTALGDRMAQRGMGAAAGASIGGAVLGPVGAAAGGVAGGIIGPKVGKAAAQAIQNAVDSGAFARLSPVRQGLIRAMAKMGDNESILKVLGTAATEEGATSATR